MSVGSVLLQPQRLARVSRDPRQAIAQDLLRLLVLLAEDAGDEGPLTGVMPALVARLGSRIQDQAGAGARGVFDTLKSRFQPALLYFESLVDEVQALEDDPARLLALIRDIIAGIQSLLEATSQAEIKSWLDFALGLINDDLGVDRDFIGRQIGLLFDDLIAQWQALPADVSPLRRRRRRLAIQIVRRLRAHLVDRFELPAVNTARAAAKLYALLRSSNVRQIFEEIHCVLERIDGVLEAATGIAEDLPFAASGAAVGAAPVQLPGATHYSWYASWLLADEDLPLLSLGDVDAKQFAIALRFRTGASPQMRAVSKYLFSTLSLAQQRQLMDYPGGDQEPDEALMVMLLAHINTMMQRGPLFTYERFSSPLDNPGEENLDRLPFEFTLRTEDAFTLPGDLDEMADDYEEEQCLFLYNRRFMEWAFTSNAIDPLCHWFWRFLGRKALGAVDWKRHDVYVTGDGRYVMCDDIPLYAAPEGEQAKWYDAPLFIDKDSAQRPARGATYYHFIRVSASTCDILAQVFEKLDQAARPIWHLADWQPGHMIGTGLVSGLDFAHLLHELLFFKPITGHASARWLTKWLNSGVIGLRGMSLIGGSFEGKHSTATGDNIFWFWVTVFLGDVIRVSGHNSIVHTVRDLVLSFFTLLNASASNSGDSSLPGNPAANHLKQAGITSPMNTLFAYLLILVYERENHSVEIWSADDIGDRREHAFGLWVGGGLGFGILAGLSGSIVSQFISWQEDWKLLGITIAESAATLFLGYWFFEYFFKEGDTADGTYALTGEYRGYPPQSSSPYRLPIAPGTAFYMGQGHNGLFSHNDITNLGGNWQIYAHDLGHDHQQMVHAMRAGVVWDFDDTQADNNEDDANFIIIRHDVPSQYSEHDDPRRTGMNQVTFARYVHGAQGGVTRAFGGTAPGTELSGAGNGAVVTQGRAIMEADDTGTSFHSHLHVYIVTGAQRNPGAQSIPLVFQDVGGDGVMKFLTWYRAGE